MKVVYEGAEYYRHNWDPFVIQFSEGFGIRWYGLAYVLGFLTAAWLLSLYFKKGKSPFNKDQQYNVLLILVVGTMLGGRLGYMLLYDLDTLLSAPWKIIEVWKGGMASHGGIAGIVVACLYLGYRYKQSPWKVGDIVVTLGPAGILFGRLANFINGELWGKISTVPWAVVFPEAMPFGVPRHPSQLYEAVLEGLFMLVYLQFRFWRSDVTERRPGQLTGEFFILYALVRIFGEQFREPDAALILGMSRGIFYSIVMLLVGVAFVVARRKTKPTGPQDSDKS
ncbi:MAG: prolipoprotein diacylglyceryl transferase [Verrucomicrobiae bacterium]|nr:prolipoprotein diacylglyceryl transferase [Verrucomicrobiae bacterium]